MTRETQNTIMVWSAVFMIVVGVALNIAGFIVPPTGEISDSPKKFAWGKTPSVFPQVPYLRSERVARRAIRLSR